MSKNFLQKKPDTMLDWMCLVFASIAFYLLLNNLGYFVGGISIFLDILSPFAGGVKISVENTAQATGLIVSHPGLFVDYEVQKGNMDDVFLSVTGKTLKEGGAEQ